MKKISAFILSVAFVAQIFFAGYARAEGINVFPPDGCSPTELKAITWIDDKTTNTQCKSMQEVLVQAFNNLKCTDGQVIADKLVDGKHTAVCKTPTSAWKNHFWGYFEPALGVETEHGETVSHSQCNNNLQLVFADGSTTTCYSTNKGFDRCYQLMGCSYSSIDRYGNKNWNCSTINKNVQPYYKCRSVSDGNVFDQETSNTGWVPMHSMYLAICLKGNPYANNRCACPEGTVGYAAVGVYGGSNDIEVNENDEATTASLPPYNNRGWYASSPFPCKRNPGGSEYDDVCPNQIMTMCK